MASLQLDDKHICSSSMFKKGFLLTARICAWYIGKCIEQKHQKGTAVFGDLNSKNRQIILISKIAYHEQALESIFDDYGIGVIMVGRLKRLDFIQKLTFDCT